MAWSPEAIIAIVGVLVNVPTFFLVLWRMCRKRNNNASNPARSLEAGRSEFPLLHPRRFTCETGYALALPYAVPVINMAQQAGRQ